MDALKVVDWRRHIFALYAAVRAETDPATAHARWRDERDDLFARHPATPLLAEHRTGFAGLAVAPYDARWRFAVPVLPADPERWEVHTGTDGVVPFDRVGVVALPEIGELEVWRLASYGGGVFVPLHDGGSGQPDGSYGGGRYVLDTVKGADLGGDDDRLVVDLNFAYAPSCSYDPAWACPLPPAGNRVDTWVPVGELQPPRSS